VLVSQFKPHPWLFACGPDAITVPSGGSVEKYWQEKDTTPLAVDPTQYHPAVGSGDPPQMARQIASVACGPDTTPAGGAVYRPHPSGVQYHLATQPAATVSASVW